MIERYRIVRFYFKHGRKRHPKCGLTLQQAQAHCNNPETSSSTCKSAAGRSRTRKHGPWFDGYEKQ